MPPIQSPKRDQYKQAAYSILQKYGVPTKDSFEAFSQYLDTPEGADDVYNILNDDLHINNLPSREDFYPSYWAPHDHSEAMSRHSRQSGIPNTPAAPSPVGSRPAATEGSQSEPEYPPSSSLGILQGHVGSRPADPQPAPSAPASVAPEAQRAAGEQSEPAVNPLPYRAEAAAEGSQGPHSAEGASPMTPGPASPQKKAPQPVKAPAPSQPSHPAASRPAANASEQSEPAPQQDFIISIPSFQTPAPTPQKKPAPKAPAPKKQDPMAPVLTDKGTVQVGGRKILDIVYNGRHISVPAQEIVSAGGWGQWVARERRKGGKLGGSKGLSVAEALAISSGKAKFGVKLKNQKTARPATSNSPSSTST